jgi:hypothetical protein
VKQQAYIILLLTSFSPFAAQSGLIADSSPTKWTIAASVGGTAIISIAAFTLFKEAPNRSSTWNLTAGFTCTAAAGAGAALAIHKAQHIPLLYKCHFPVATALLVTKHCAHYAEHCEMSSEQLPRFERYPFRSLVIGAMFGTAAVTCASACYYFFNK